MVGVAPEPIDGRKQLLFMGHEKCDQAQLRHPSLHAFFQGGCRCLIDWKMKEPLREGPCLAGGESEMIHGDLVYIAEATILLVETDKPLKEEVGKILRQL